MGSKEEATFDFEAQGAEGICTIDPEMAISRDGGIPPHWNREGDRLLFIGVRAPDLREVDFALDSAAEPQIGLPRILGDLPRETRGFGADQSRFLVGLAADNVEHRMATVLVGWGASVHGSR